MKKFLLAILFIIPFAANSQKEQGKYSVYVQGGFFSNFYIREAVQKTIVSKTDTRGHTCPILNVGLLRSVGKTWRLGPVFSYEHFGLKDRSVEFGVFGYSLRGDGIWKKGKNISLYSGSSMGWRMLKKLENNKMVEKETGLCYQVYLIGADIKVYKFLIDINVGYGASGLGNLGVIYRFD